MNLGLVGGSPRETSQSETLSKSEREDLYAWLPKSAWCCTTLTTFPEDPPRIAHARQRDGEKTVSLLGFAYT